MGFTAFFFTFQKATLGSGSPIDLGHFVLQEHGDLALVGFHCFFLHFPESNIRQWQPNRPGPLRPSGALGFRVSKCGFGWASLLSSSLSGKQR